MSGSTSRRRWPWFLVAVASGAVLASALYPLVMEPRNRLLSVVLIAFSGLGLWLAIGRLRPSATIERAWWLLPVAAVIVAAVIAPWADTAFPVDFLVLAAASASGIWFSRS